MHLVGLLSSYSHKQVCQLIMQDAGSRCFVIPCEWLILGKLFCHCKQRKNVRHKITFSITRRHFDHGTFIFVSKSTTSAWQVSVCPLLFVSKTHNRPNRDPSFTAVPCQPAQHSAVKHSDTFAFSSLSQRVPWHEQCCRRLRDNKCWMSPILATWSAARFEVLSAVILRIRVFWDVIQCRWIKIPGRFKGNFCLNLKR